MGESKAKGPIELACDKCKKKFYLKEPKKMEVNLDAEVFEVTYFKCTECGNIYLVSIENEDTRRRKAEYREQERLVLSIAISMNKRADFNKMYKVEMKKKEKLKEKYMNKQSALKRRYGNKIKEHITQQEEPSK